MQRTLTLALAAMFLFIMANANPIMMLNIEGQIQAASLITAIQALYQQGMWLLALVVLTTSIIVPLAQISGMLYLLVPLNFNRIPPKTERILRWIHQIQPWGMVEAFLLGVLISIVKLAKMADIVPGLAMYSLGVLIFVLTAATTSLDPHQIWEILGVKKQ